MKVNIYTDGACVGNPGPGGWAAIIIKEKQKKELFGGEKLTTNNRLELTAAIKGLEYCNSEEGEQPSLKEIKIYTDSVYLKDGITVWIKKWEKNGWKSSNNQPIKNKDLWLELNKLSSEHKVSWNWVEGHSNNEFNNLADKLATEAIKN